MPQLSTSVTALLLGAVAASLMDASAAARTDRLGPEQVVQDDSTLNNDAPTVVTTSTGREVVLYREDNRGSGDVLVAATRRAGQDHWRRPERLTGQGVVSYAAQATSAGQVAVAYRFHRPGSTVVVTRLRTLDRAGHWGPPQRLASERLPPQTGVTAGLELDVDRRGGVVAAWPARQGVRVVVRRSAGSARQRELFPQVDSVVLAHLTPRGVVDVVGTRTGAHGRSGIVLQQTPGAAWQRVCFVNCASPRRPLTLTAASANDRGHLAVAWTHPSSRGLTDNVRALVRFRTPTGEWSSTTVLAKQVTSGAQVDVDERGRSTVSWPARPPHRSALRLGYRNPDGRWFGDRQLSSRRPSVVGDPAPVALIADRASTLVLYEQVRRFADIDQIRAVIRRCPVRGPCETWRWVPTPSTDVDAAPLPRGGASLVWADGCTVVFENCFVKRIASRRLTAMP